jgi:hypothetical protein
VEPVKAFESVNHKLTFALLEQQGAPKTPADAVWQMHANVIVKLQVGKEDHNILRTPVGQQHGNNMVPILFFFL